MYKMTVDETHNMRNGHGIRKRICYTVVILLLCPAVSGCYLFTPIARIPRPANFNCLNSGIDEGEIVPLELAPSRIYGMGLTYATHLKEIGAEFDPKTPAAVFKKALTSLNRSGSPVRVPDRQALIECAEEIEPGLGKTVDKKFRNLPPLLDYEGELAFLLLDDVDWTKINDPAYTPQIGYFLANDISARTIAILGEDKANKYDYWGASKSFPGFLPVGNKMWVSAADKPDSILCTTIVTKINGEIRQKQSTSDMVYTPREMLYFIHERFPEDLPQKGDIVLTGTPGGVAFQVPAWKAWISDIFDLDRFVKLVASIASAGKNRKFLKPGDLVEVSSGELGTVAIKIE